MKHVMILATDKFNRSEEIHQPIILSQIFHLYKIKWHKTCWDFTIFSLIKTKIQIFIAGKYLKFANFRLSLLHKL